MVKSMASAFAWPMCRYPFGSGGKRVCMWVSPFSFMSSSMNSSIKFFGARISSMVIQKPFQ